MERLGVDPTSCFPNIVVLVYGDGVVESELNHLENYAFFVTFELFIEEFFNVIRVDEL